MVAAMVFVIDDHKFRFCRPNRPRGEAGNITALTARMGGRIPKQTSMAAGSFRHKFGSSKVRASNIKLADCRILLLSCTLRLS